jgi:hypothetical protein
MKMETYYSEKQVKKLLEEQRHICQTEFDKRSVYQNGEWYVHCTDVKNAKEPEFPKGKKGKIYSDKKIERSVSFISECLKYAVEDTARISGDFNGDAGLLSLNDSYEKIAKDFIALKQQ